MSARMLAGCLLIAGLASGGAAADSGFAFRGGDRVVFLGDSITEQKPGLEAQFADREAKISAACQTKPHHFELKPSPAAPGRN